MPAEIGSEFTSYLSPIKNTNQAHFKDSIIENVSEGRRKYHGSELSPKLETGHLKTVQSVYSEEFSAQKEINESVIIIDFFNPSHEVKR